MSEIHLEETSDHPDAKTRDAYLDPYMKVDGGMASTQSYSLWSNLMPQFAELTRLDYFNTEIKAGRKQYKDFYVYFRQNILDKFDKAVSSELKSTNNASGNEIMNNSGGQGSSVQLKFWKQLPWDIRVKTYLTLYSVEVEAKSEDNDLSEREVNILRWAALLLHIGCAKQSKTSKIYVYSFLSALFIIQMLESGDIASELLEGSGYEEMINFADTMMESVDVPYQDEVDEAPIPRSPFNVQIDVEENMPSGHPQSK